MNSPPAINRVLTCDDSCGTSRDYILRPDVLCVEVWDGTSRVIDFGGESFGLNVTATRMLTTTLTLGSTAAIQQLFASSVISEEQICEDHASLFGDLVRRGVVQRKEMSQSNSNLKGFLPYVGGKLVESCCIRAATSRSALITLMTLGSIYVRCFGWAKTLRLWRRAVHNATAARVSGLEISIAQFSSNVKNALASCPVPVDCKVRALTSASVLSAAGMPAEIVIGIDLFPFLGHCWCECEGTAIADRIDRCTRFTPVIRHSFG